MTRRDETIKAERNPHTIAPTVGTVREDSGKGIMQLHEAIQRGKLKLREHKEDWVQLRKTSMILDGEINKLKIKVAQACYTEKLSTMGQGMASHTTTLEEFVTLLPWLQPHLTRHSKQGSTLHKEEHEVLTSVRVTKEGELKPCTSGVTT